MVADALTKRRSDVSRPTDAFRNISLGGKICICNIVDAKLLNRFRFTIQAHMARFSCCLRLNKTRGFPSPYKHIRDDLQLQDAFIGAERAEMTSYTSEQNLPR